MSIRRTLSEPSLNRTRSTTGAFSRSRRFEPPERFWVDYSCRSGGNGGYPSRRSPSAPVAPSVSRKPASTNSPQPPGVRSVQRSASVSDVAQGPPPIHELVPAQLKSKVLKLVKAAPPLGPKHRGVVCIEMNWSESGYLPAHAQPLSEDPDTYIWGEKYKRLAAELRKALSDKGVSVVDFKTPSGLKKGNGIYDRFSEWERHLPRGNASNVSHKSSGPSRIWVTVKEFRLISYHTGCIYIYIVNNTVSPS